jgi:predicted trehalose synthase
MTMLDVFEIDKALYELMYEQLHRPDWVRIPIRGIAQVTEREPTR